MRPARPGWQADSSSTRAGSPASAPPNCCAVPGSWEPTRRRWAAAAERAAAGRGVLGSGSWLAGASWHAHTSPTQQLVETSLSVGRGCRSAPAAPGTARKAGRPGRPLALTSCAMTKPPPQDQPSPSPAFFSHTKARPLAKRSTSLGISGPPAAGGRAGGRAGRVRAAQGTSFCTGNLLFCTGNFLQANRSE